MGLLNDVWIGRDLAVPRAVTVPHRLQMADLLSSGLMLEKVQTRLIFVLDL